MRPLLSPAELAVPIGVQIAAIWRWITTTTTMANGGVPIVESGSALQLLHALRFGINALYSARCFAPVDESLFVNRV